MMKRFMAGILILALLFAVPVFANNGTRQALVADSYGTVTVMKSGGERTFPAFNGMGLSMGDRIMTASDSWVLLKFDSDKEVKIDENTDLVISDISFDEKTGGQKTGLSLWTGRLWASIKRALGAEDSFEVKTPTTIMGVKGTMFFVDRTDEDTVIAVIDGKVYVIVSTGGYDEQGEYIKRELELMLEENQRLTAQDIALSMDDLIIDEISLEEIDTFILEELIKNLRERQLTDPDPEDEALLNRAETILEEKRSEEAGRTPEPPKTPGSKNIVYERDEEMEPEEPSTTTPLVYADGLAPETGLNTSYGAVNILENRYDYELDVPGDAEYIKLKPTISGDFTDGTIEINWGLTTGIFVMSGEESGEIPLDEGETLITITVSQPNRISRIYRIKVIKIKPSFVFLDEFDTGELNEAWTVLYPDYEAISLSELDGHLSLVPLSGDPYYYPERTTRNIFTVDPPGTDFSIGAKVAFMVDDPNSQAGIMVYSDEYNFFAITRQYDRSTGKSAIYVTCRQGYFEGLAKYVDHVSTGGIVIQAIQDTIDYIYFKIIKDGTSYSAYYSYDSQIWYEAGLSTPQLDFTNPKGALYATGEWGWYSSQAHFDYFELTDDISAPENVIPGEVLADDVGPFVAYPLSEYVLRPDDELFLEFNEEITPESKQRVEEEILSSLDLLEDPEREYITFIWDEYSTDKLYYVLTISNTNGGGRYFFDDDIWVELEDMSGNTSMELILYIMAA